MLEWNSFRKEIRGRTFWHMGAQRKARSYLIETKTKLHTETTQLFVIERVTIMFCSTFVYTNALRCAISRNRYRIKIWRKLISLPSAIHCLQIFVKMFRSVSSEQCDQLARLVCQYLAIYNTEILPNIIKICQSR